MKYIDAEKLTRFEETLADIIVSSQGLCTYEACKDIAKREAPFLITSLQQEQPDKYETALEKAREWMPNVNQGGHAMLISIFPELGEGLDPRYGGRKQEQPEVDLVAELKHHLATTPKEQLEKEWKELEPWGNIGPTVQEFLYRKQPAADLEKEMSRLIREYFKNPNYDKDFIAEVDWEHSMKDFARYFYELGLKAKK